MYAIIKTGGKQYRVSEGDTVRVELLPGDKGQEITFNEVLMVSRDGAVTVGKPRLTDASVTATITDQALDRKILIMHRKPQSHHTLRGHRQPYTEIKITAIKA